MPTQINEPKIQSELFKVVVLFNDLTRSREFKRYSPMTKEVIAILMDMLRLCKAAIHDRRPITFELRCWEQTTLGGAFFELTDQQIEERVEYGKFATGDEEYSLLE